jgi:uncharacterized delta-60 repeat protein
MGWRAGIAVVIVVSGLAVLSVALAAPGKLDSAFGSGGKVVTDVGGLDWAGSVAIAPNGAVVVAGGSGDDLVLARYDAAGRLDSSLGGRGTVVTDLGGGNDGAGAVLVQPDGRIVVAAQRDGDLALVRYTSNGALDPSFGSGGVVVTDLGFEERAITVLRQPSGRLLVVCAAPDRLVLARFLADGRLDVGFQGDGIASTRTPAIDWRIAVRARHGKIVVAGAREVSRPTQAMALAVARYRPDGRLDRTFSGEGVAMTKTRPHWHGAVKLAVRRDGRVVLGTHGHSSRGRAGFALASLRRDGSVDRSFGDGGVIVNEVGYGVHALALDRRGRIVTVGRTTSLRDFVVARFLPDGRRDRRFAATVTDFGGIDTPFALALQTDGKIVAVGASSASSTSLVGDIALARYLSSD